MLSFKMFYVNSADFLGIRKTKSKKLGKNNLNCVWGGGTLSDTSECAHCSNAIMTTCALATYCTMKLPPDPISHRGCAAEIGLSNPHSFCN